MTADGQKFALDGLTALSRLSDEESVEAINEAGRVRHAIAGEES
jgi:hypothetical protein